MSLNSAEINIKNHIVKYPDLFQSRSSVLNFVLLTDPESRWTPEGTIDSLNISQEDVSNPKLDISSLGSTPSELSSLCSIYITPMQIHRELEMAKYLVIEKHLDTLVKVSMPNDKLLSASDIRQINEYSLIFHIPDNVEDSWRVAVREVLDSAVIATKQEYCNHRSDGSKVDHWVYPFAFELYHKLIGEQKRFMPKLNVSPETAERLKKLRDLLG